MRFEVLAGLSAYGPPAASFTENGPREWREGLVVRFYPTDSEPWIGNFPGGMTKCNSVLDHPNRRDVVIVASGEAFIVDPQTRNLRDSLRVSCCHYAVYPAASESNPAPMAFRERLIEEARRTSEARGPVQ